jgi:hypothetical protein
LPGLEAGLPLEDRQHLAARRPGVRRRLEHDELGRHAAACDLRSGVADDREVRLALLGERRRESDEDRVDVPQTS